MNSSGKPTSKPGLAIRAVEDHHVDRSAVEAPQGVELTDPNRSTELAPLQERADTMLEYEFDQTTRQDLGRQKRPKSWQP